MLKSLYSLSLYLRNQCCSISEKVNSSHSISYNRTRYLILTSNNTIEKTTKLTAMMYYIFI